MFNVEKSNRNNWKGKSKKYLVELQSFLDKAENIEDEELKKEIINKMLKCDNELTLLSEKLFEEFYNEGYKDGRSEK